MNRLAFVWLVVVALAAGPVPGSARADEPRPAKKVTAADVLKEWKPKLVGAGQEWNATGGSPKDAPDVAAVSFRLTGWTFEEVWNHYAEKCGVEQRYKEKGILIATGKSPKGEYVVSDQLTSLDANAKRAVTTFLLKTDGYTATVSFHPGEDGKRIFGTLTVVMK